MTLVIQAKHVGNVSRTGRFEKFSKVVGIVLRDRWSAVYDVTANGRYGVLTFIWLL